MSTPRKRRTATTGCKSASEKTPKTSSTSERVVIVVGAEPTYAETVAQGFAVQGEAMRVMWFAEACQALAAGVQKALAGVIVCHRPEKTPDEELGTLRRAWPDTPVLAWQLV